MHQDNVHCHTLGVDGSQIGVFEQRDEVRLSSFLQRHDGGRLETEIGLRYDERRPDKRRTAPHLEILGDFTDETLEGQLANKQLRRLLVPPNFTEGNGTRTEPVRLLHTTGGGLL